MRRHATPLRLALAIFLISAISVQAKLDEYRFSTSTSYWFSDWTTEQYIFFDNPDDGTSQVLDMGFPFYFDGTAYNQFTVSSNGLIGLGDRPVSSCWTNELLKASESCNGIEDPPFPYSLGGTPHIAAYWDDLRADFGSVTSTIMGEAPNRIQVISFSFIETSYQSFVFSWWQVRLYEGSNKIEFYYDYLNPTYFNDGATIGLAASASNFLSVTPDFGGFATASSEQPNDGYFPSFPDIPSGTLYTFDPCRVTGIGDLSHSESRALRSGDTLLLGQGAPLFSSVDFSPVSLSLSGPNPCNGNTHVWFFLEGDGYSVEPFDGDISGGASLVPTITFTPTSIGQSIGILSVVDETGDKVVYYLAAEGRTRLQFTGNIPQGGTAAMADGDVLMSNLHIRRGQSQGFTPFTITNNTLGEGVPADVTFALQGISGGQYSISQTSASLHGGESVTPVITFSPTGIGATSEVLIVNAEGQEIRYNLRAFSDGVSGQFIVAATPLQNGASIFANQFSCTGSGNVTLPVVVSNIGSLPFEVTRLDVYSTDTNYKQGQPGYPLLRNGANQFIPAGDYFLSAAMPTPPFADDVLSLPVTLQPGENRTLYLTFVSQQPGKRFARAFLYSNDEVASGIGPNGETVPGLRTFDLFGRGTGAQLAGSASGDHLGSVIFSSTEVGITGRATRSVFNTGTCDLIISPKDLRITSGDVEEFSIISTPEPDVITGNIIIKPGQSADFTFGFTPVQVGSRRAAVRFRTNDSTVQVPGITERGVYYLNLFGGGASGLYLNDIDFGQALIGGTISEQPRAVVRLINSNAAPLKITSMVFDGVDNTEFREDPASTWPSTPFFLQPGEEREISVVFAPAAGGVIGSRTAGLTIETSLGTQATARLTGIAGTRTMSVNPPAISFAAMTTGKQQRHTVTITNTGTMPMQLATPEVTGPDAASFRLGSLGRTDIEPGGSAYLEVTYAPTTTGPVAATLTIGSNTTDGPGEVLLSGTSFISKGEDGGTPLSGRGTLQDGVGRNDNLSTSGVGSENMGGLALSQSVPNPGRETVVISYTLPATAQMELALYDAAGHLVRVVAEGLRQAGSHDVRIDVRDLPVGVYHYRLVSNGRTMVKSLQIIR